jgi:8-oxo-dGTP diphosphatase
VLGDEHGVLLGRRLIDPGRGRWSFPAGYVNRGEVLEEAAAREVAEELHVGVRISGLVGVYSARDDPVVLVVYAGEIVEGEPRADGREVGEVRRFRLDALPEPAFAHDRRVLADWRRRYAAANRPGPGGA